MTGKIQQKHGRNLKLWPIVYFMSMVSGGTPLQSTHPAIQYNKGWMSTWKWKKRWTLTSASDMIMWIDLWNSLRTTGIYLGSIQRSIHSGARHRLWELCFGYRRQCWRMSGGMGLHHNYTQWDIKGLPSSAWNQVVVKNFVNQVVEKLPENQPPLFQNKSRKYWKATIHDNFIHIKGKWAHAQPCMMKSGCIEVANEVEKCRCKYINGKLKRARVWKRRVKVSS